MERRSGSSQTLRARSRPTSESLTSRRRPSEAKPSNGRRRFVAPTAYPFEAHIAAIATIGGNLWRSRGTCRTRAGSRSPFVGGHGSVRSAHFRSYTSRTRKPRVNVVKSLDSRSNKSAPHGAHAGRRSLRSRLSEMRTGREGPYRGDVPRRHQDGSHLMQVVGNDATTL